MIPALLALAVALDTLTFLRIWPQEANPLVLALGAGPAIAARWFVVTSALTLTYLAKPYRRALRRGLLFAAWASAFGAATNVWTWMGVPR